MSSFKPRPRRLVRQHQSDDAQLLVALKLVDTAAAMLKIVHPIGYLPDVYARLPTTSPEELPLLLPDGWTEDHAQHRIQERVQDWELLAYNHSARYYRKSRKVAFEIEQG